MLKVLLFVAIGLTGAQASADALGSKDKITQFDNAYCSVVAENYSRGKLSDLGLEGRVTSSEVYQFSDDIYTVLVKTQVYQDSLLIDGPEIGFNCFRCKNSKLVVTQDSMKKACANEQQ